MKATQIAAQTNPAHQVGDRIQVRHQGQLTPGRISSVHHVGSGVEYVIRLDAADGGLGDTINVALSSTRSANRNGQRCVLVSVSTGDTTYSSRQALARFVLITAVNGGINRWARVNGYQADVAPGQVSAEGVDITDNRLIWRVTLDDLQQAIIKITENPESCAQCFAPDSDFGQLVTRLRVIGAQLASGIALGDIPEIGGLDPTGAGLIFQVAAFGAVIHP